MYQMFMNTQLLSHTALTPPPPPQGALSGGRGHGDREGVLYMGAVVSDQGENEENTSSAEWPRILQTDSD